MIFAPILLCMQVFSLILSLPATTTAIVGLHDPVTVPGEYGKCPSQADRQAAFQRISTNVSSILMDFANNISEVPNCGEGMWHQVINLDMTDPSQQCPSTWIQLQNNDIRVCAGDDVGNSRAICESAFYPAGRQYRKVCGRATGYQIGGVAGFGWTAVHALNASYVYGLSITYGAPHTHIWTFAAGISEQARYAGSGWECPCNSPGHPIAVPSFVGNNYFCESGSPTTYTSNHWYTHDRLWDGEQCADEGTCCNGQDFSPPWFSVVLPTLTSDDIEARICKPSSPGENIVIEKLEIYIQ